MKNLKGFTLIELMIVVAIIAILVAVVGAAFRGNIGEWGVTCKAGYKFTSGAYGTQIYDENGRAIPCQK